MMESLHLRSATSVDWRSFCCEVTDYWFANQEAIGGVGIEVELHEILKSRRKYGRGHSGGFKVGGARGKTKKGAPLMTSSNSANRDKHFDQA